MQKTIKDSAKEIKVLNESQLKIIISDLSEELKIIKSIKFLTGLIRINSLAQDVADSVKSQLLNKGIGLIGVESENKFLLVCSVTKDMTDILNAGNIIKKISEDMGESGGGSNHMAFKVFNNINDLNKALKIGEKNIQELCKQYEC